MGIRDFLERILYEGYTYNELCQLAGGGDGGGNDSSSDSDFGADATHDHSNGGIDADGISSDGFDGVIGAEEGTNVALSTNPAHAELANAITGGTVNEGGIFGITDLSNYNDVSFSIDYNNITTTFSIQDNVGVSSTNTGWLDTTLDYAYATNLTTKTTVELGTIGKHTLDLGASPEVATLVDGLSKVALGILVGASEIAVGLALANFVNNELGISGAISKETYGSINKAIATADLLNTSLNTMQNVGSIASSFNQMTTTTKAIALLAAYSEISNLKTKYDHFAEAYGVSLDNMSNDTLEDFNNSQFGTLSYTTVESAIDAYQQYISYDSIRTYDNIFDRMAGGVIFDIFIAGSWMYNTEEPFYTFKGSVGGDINTSSYFKQTYYEEDYLNTLDGYLNLISKFG